MEVTPESVRQALTSEDLGDRLRAVNQLRRLEPTTAFPILQTAIADPNARVRYAAVSQMSSLGSQDLDLALEILRDRLLNDPEMDVQSVAADALAALHLTSAFEDLQTLFHQTSEWLLQFSIIAALGELGDPRAYDLLVSLLDGDPGLLQLAAVGSLGELGDRRAIPLLANYVTDADWQLRHRVAQALSHLGGEQAKGLLTQMAADPIAQVAEAAQIGLKTED
ncbi:MAG: HEAT repeat domain-containing protein [Aphanocapsa sp. GSE-SYN-MK-11-07L]|jgi:HEAT repeat protein|nr:HEAT repeat domain-containing protein [Aphanocapsa sp. GSE-SYN-MK-11-07L]